MTNFEWFMKVPELAPFARVALTAEENYNRDVNTCLFNCRRAMELGVKWMYQIDTYLEIPYGANLNDLLHEPTFCEIVDGELRARLNLVRRLGNTAAHEEDKLKPFDARVGLENLYEFFNYLGCCYCDPSFEEGTFDAALLEQPAEEAPKWSMEEIEAILKENAKLKDALTARREQQQPSYTSKPIDMTEDATRKVYIDAMLRDAGWREGDNWQNEVELVGMPNKAGVGYADYVLYDDARKPLAVIEAKRTSVDVSKGRQQALEYAKLLEAQSGRRVVVFLTNGFETRIIDGQYPERPVAAIYSKRDLEKLFNLRSVKKSLSTVNVNQDIAGRYYQVGAIKAVCDAFDRQNKRKALLVMATGSGKTRTVIGLVDVLIRRGWVKNVLFLADRTALVTQAKRSFANMLPNLPLCNLVEEKDNTTARCVFSTYQTMMSCLDEVYDDEGKLFTVGHFDLVIVDEAHRSIYNKYRDIFNYFDAPLVGLTATPKDEIDKNTYGVFGLEDGMPTYGYELSQAVTDGYLVDYMSVECKVKFMEEGIRYDELSEADRAQYEETFTEDGDMPEEIGAAALNQWLYNEDTIRQVLAVLMEHGMMVEYNTKIGKTIIFAKSHAHAEKIYEVFNKEYPHLVGYAKVIDNYTNYAQAAIDEFSDARKLPQIAISVDMLDTGIDVPEVVNLVFFKKVMSKAKFWQMIGRGTRLCPNLLDGADKNGFYIFDFCSNFEFFRLQKGKPTPNQVPLQTALFNLKAQIVQKLQDMAYQQDDALRLFAEDLIDELVAKVRALNREHFAVRQHLRYVDEFSHRERFEPLSESDVALLKEEVAPLILPDSDDAQALRFDALMYGIEAAYLVGKTKEKALRDLRKKTRAISGLFTINEIAEQGELIDKILHTTYVDTAGINEFEHIRENLRDLMKYIQPDKRRYDTNFADEILSVEWKEAELENDDLANYKARAEHYVRQHEDNPAIAKLKTNVPLDESDMAALEGILWSEVGSREDYEREYGEKPLGEFVRGIVGLDMNAAKAAFAKFLEDTNLDSRQIYFVNQIVEYIVHNGTLTDYTVLLEAPFNNQGSFTEIFEDLSVFAQIRQTIESINMNALG